jgi:hypothetical protein
MNKSHSGVLILMLLCVSVRGQIPVGSWNNHFSYTSISNIAADTKEIYASAGTSLLIFNKEYSELKTMSVINGLSETGISSIAWSEDYKTLIIIYSSANIDLLKNNTIYNIPDVKQKIVAGNKKIFNVRISGKYAYLASSLGIIAVDIVKNEIYDTWNPSSGSEMAVVNDIAFGNGKIYAATDNGVFYADMSNQGLAYFGNWHIISTLPYPTGKYTNILFSGGKLYVNKSDIASGGDSVYVIDGTCNLFSYFPGSYVSSFDNITSGFAISYHNMVKYYNSNGSIIRTIVPDWGESDIAQTISDYDNNIWIADRKSGLIKGESTSLFTKLTLPGPVSNNAFHINSLSGKTVICGGAVDLSWDATLRPLQVSVYENNSWSNITTPTIKDAIRSVIDPNDLNHIFISTWGDGLAEYRNNILVNRYTNENSPLKYTTGKTSVKVCGMAIDNSGNLWITQTGVHESIKVLKHDGNWIVNPITIDAPVIGDITITKKGHKWIILPEGHGLFALNDNNTPENFNDDRYKKFNVKDSEGNTIPYVYSITEDLDGNIWIGTNEGPMIYYNPEKIFDSDLTASRIIISREDGTGLGDYMLGTETITTVTVDGANRKWLGTMGSGAYLLSSDGKTRIKNFNEANSPIASDTITTIAVDDKSGEVWFGTTKGVQVYRDIATNGEKDFTNVYSFPNPVRENFNGNVTITGLMSGSQVLITDISGNLVYKTESEGGQASWDLKTYNGKKVTTGVYLIFCSNSDGTKSFVSKMLVIK